MANMTSSIAALGSLGIEAGIGVFCAFFLTGLWVPLTRLESTTGWSPRVGWRRALDVST
ncbi:MAG: hypothetical protein Ct9H90mP21_1040 [Methanobacteriota archaeon]|nr:MAG: hypothetical protein Ct9H90mP21_1040 [Euryarchaeota archaeon]